VKCNKHAYVNLVLSAIFVLCLGALIAPLGGCGTLAPTNTGQAQGNPNGENLNVQGNYIRYLSVDNITVQLPAGTVTTSPDARVMPPFAIVGAPAFDKAGDQRITSQPAATGDAKGGDVASGNQLPVAAGMNPTANQTGDNTKTDTPTISSGGDKPSASPPATTPATTTTTTTTKPSADLGSGGGTQ